MAWDQDSEATVVTGGRDRAAVDAGLRSHMVRVYNTMGLGLVVTAFVSFLIAATPDLRNVFLGNQIVFLIFAFAPLVFLWVGFSPSRLHRSSAAKVRGMFYLFAALFGVSLSSIFVAYTGESIVRVFFITSATFLAMSLWGYTTKRDLSGMGSFLFMGLIGIIIASVVNIFLASSMLQWIVSVAGVLIFTGMTAWDTQRIKETYQQALGDETNGKLATMGALSLYLNFVLLFQHLIHLLGQRQ